MQQGVQKVNILIKYFYCTQLLLDHQFKNVRVLLSKKIDFLQFFCNQIGPETSKQMLQTF